jgi:large subunit ribosomal protein L6
MSRVGRNPIHVPSGTKVEITPANTVKVTGPKGALERTLNADMAISQEGDVITVARPSDSKEHCSQHGLTRTLLSNMVDGVSKGFSKELEIVGVGYRAEQKGSDLNLRIGYSHEVPVVPMPGITLIAESNTKIIVSGVSKEDVGEQAARIKRIRPPDAYKGKGIRYAGEIIRLKPGKAGKAIGG